MMRNPGYTILEYASSLNFHLFPVQRVVLKALYGLELDNKKTFVVPYWAAGHFEERSYTEASYLEMLWYERRSSIGFVKAGGEKNELVLAAGRRSGKSVLGPIIAAYELHGLMVMEDPQARYGLGQGPAIQVLLVGTDREQAQLALREAANHARLDPAVGKFLHGSTQAYSTYMTVADFRRHGIRPVDDDTIGNNASIRLAAKSGRSTGIRGIPNMCVILDEVAHFSENGQPAEIYDAVQPSVAWTSPKDEGMNPIGMLEYKIVSLSTPLLAKGAFHDRWQRGFTNFGSLSLRIPSWEMNPTLDQEFLLKEHQRDPAGFMCEYGAGFRNEPVGRNTGTVCPCCNGTGRGMA